MKQIKLPIDLVTINTNAVLEGIKTLNYCSKNISFNNIYLFSNENHKGEFDLIKINKLESVEEYNYIILSLKKYIKSEFVLIVQHDGHILNPHKWNNNFLNFDYIGAPWPNNKKWNKRWNEYEDGKTIINNLNRNRIGNGGFSLRSQKFLEYSTKFENSKLPVPEDIFLNVLNYEIALENHIKYPDIKEAMQFSYETPLRGKKLELNKKYHYLNKRKHFGWHGKMFLNSQKLLNLKNN